MRLHEGALARIRPPVRAGLGRPADQCASRARCSKGRCKAGSVSQGGPVHAGRPKGQGDSVGGALPPQ